jgi:hypothetical protein
MEYNRSSQFNRGRCVTRPKYNYVIVEDESELLPDNLPAEKDKQNIAAHNAGGHNKDTMKRERIQI